jgi:hypothetical protein
MTGFDLPFNFNDNPESLVRRVRPRVLIPQKFFSNQETNTIDLVDNTSSAPMAERTIHEFSAPSNTNVPTRPTTTVGDGNIELKTALINMVQANPFSGKTNEYANAHLQHFLEVCRTFTIYGVTDDAILFRLFPFSLLGKAKQWFYAERYAINTWDKCSKAFLAKFFPVGKTNALRARILGFQ